MTHVNFLIIAERRAEFSRGSLAAQLQVEEVWAPFSKSAEERMSASYPSFYKVTKPRLIHARTVMMMVCLRRLEHEQVVVISH